MLEIRHLKFLAAVRETGSLTAAAARVGLTQSAASHLLAGLEHYLDLRLVERGRGGARFTPAGERLLRLAESVLPEIEAARADLKRMASEPAGERLRIAVECHTCFEWLMPAMDAYRQQRPEAELDLVGGFHAEPLSLLLEDKADCVIVSENGRQSGIAYFPLFRYEMVALLPQGHVLAKRARLDAADFARETLITYPVPDRMLDLVRRVLKPAGIDPPRRQAELTIAILQLVASRRGIACLPRWAVENYIDSGYVVARPVGRKGLWGELYMAVRNREKAEREAFARVLRQVVRQTLRGIELIDAAGQDASRSA